MKSDQGITLLELVVATAIWMILLLGASQLIVHTARVAAYVSVGQDIHEHARVAMDSLIVNIQMADEIEIWADPDGMLRRLTLHQINPMELREAYTFTYNRNANPTDASFRRINFSGTNELASFITEVRLVVSYDSKFIYLTVTADDRFTIQSTVDIRYKELAIRS